MSGKSLNIYPGSSSLPKFTAKRKDSEKKYYCYLIDEFDKERYLPIYEECKKHRSIVSLDDQIIINNITCVFYEVGEVIKNPIDEKKLIEMFIELNDINLAEGKIMIYYYTDEIIFKDGRYQIYPSAVYEKHIEEYSLIVDIFMIFKLFKLSLLNKIEEIRLDIRRKKLRMETVEERLEHLAENYLNKSIEETCFLNKRLKVLV